MDATYRWYYGWNVIGAGLFFQAVMYGLTLFSLIFWAPIWAEEFETSLASVMWANVGMMLVQGLVSPFIGRAMDRYPIKWMVCAGAVIASLGFLVISVSNDIAQIVAVYCTLLPLGMALAGPLPAQTLAAKWFDRNRGLAMGVSTTGTSVGGIMIPIVVGLLYVEVGWRVTHQVLALLALTMIPVVLAFVSNTPEDKGLSERVENNERENDSTSKAEWTTASIFGQRNFWIIVAAFVPLIAAQTAIQANLAALAIELGTDKSSTPMLISILSVAMIFGKVAFGRQADYWDHRYLFLLACLITACVILYVLVEPGYVGQLVMVCVLGFGNGAILPLLGAVISTRFGPDSYGTVMGLLGPFLLFSYLGSVVVASSYDTTGSFSTALTVLLFLIAPAALIVMWLGKEKAVPN